MSNSLDSLTWTCHVCGDVRPDDRIDVYRLDISKQFGLAKGSATCNVRFCNDRPCCLEKVRERSLEMLPETNQP